MKMICVYIHENIYIIELVQDIFEFKIKPSYLDYLKGLSLELYMSKKKKKKFLSHLNIDKIIKNQINLKRL